MIDFKKNKIKNFQIVIFLFLSFLSLFFFLIKDFQFKYIIYFFLFFILSLINIIFIKFKYLNKIYEIYFISLISIIFFFYIFEIFILYKNYSSNPKIRNYKIELRLT